MDFHLKTVGKTAGNIILFIIATCISTAISIVAGTIVLEATSVDDILWVVAAAKVAWSVLGDVAIITTEVVAYYYIKYWATGQFRDEGATFSIPIKDNWIKILVLVLLIFLASIPLYIFSIAFLALQAGG